MSAKNINDFLIYDSARLTKQVIYKEEKSQAFVLNLIPGQKLPPHNHPNAHVYLLVIEGGGMCGIDDQLFNIHERDAIHCGDKQMLAIENTSDKNLSLYVILTREAK